VISDWTLGISAKKQHIAYGVKSQGKIWFVKYFV